MTVEEEEAEKAAMLQAQEAAKAAVAVEVTEASSKSKRKRDDDEDEDAAAVDMDKEELNDDAADADDTTAAEEGGAAKVDSADAADAAAADAATAAVVFIFGAPAKHWLVVRRVEAAHASPAGTAKQVQHFPSTREAGVAPDATCLLRDVSRSISRLFSRIVLSEKVERVV